MSHGPRNRLLRALTAVIALTIDRHASKRRRERERLAAERRRALGPDAEVDGRRPLGEQAQELERRHAEIGARAERRAEPPLATEIESEPDPRAETLVIASLLAAALGGACFIVFYLVFPDTQLLGLTIGLAFLMLGVASVVAGKRVFVREKAAEEYHYFGDTERQRDVQEVVEEGGGPVTRRRLMLGAAGTAGATVGAAALVPAASLGPNVGETIYRTPWRRGRRVVDHRDRPITADDVPIGTFLTGFPEGALKEEVGSPLIIVRVPPERLELAPERRAGAPEGIIAFSKICPHAGCAVSIYRHPLYEPTEPEAALVCPCHYSTFDPERGGALMFGPAGRDLPQLPLSIGADRALVADGDFYDPVGPSYGGIRTEPDR